MKKGIILIIASFSLFLAPIQSVRADCIPQSGFPLSCPSTHQSVCNFTSEGGAGARLCCSTTADCQKKIDEVQKKAPYVRGSSSANKSPCEFAGDNKDKCESCMGTNKEAVWTAFGCLSTAATGDNNFVTTLLKFGSGIAGGIAFLLIIVGGFQIVMSAGNPEKVNEGKELVTSAIVGLLFIIFSIFMLRFIGVDLLAIPGFE